MSIPEVKHYDSFEPWMLGQLVSISVYSGPIDSEQDELVYLRAGTLDSYENSGDKHTYLLRSVQAPHQVTYAAPFYVLLSVVIPD